MINLILLPDNQEMIWIVALRKNVSVFGVILLRIFPAFGLNIERSLHIHSPYSLQCEKMREKCGAENNSEYGHFLRSATIQIISWLPLILWGWTSQIMLYLRMQHKILLKRLQTFCYGFLSIAQFLFVSSQMFRCTLVFSLADYILERKDDLLKMKKLPKLRYLLKVSNKDITGIIESCSKWKYMTRFLCS